VRGLWACPYAVDVPNTLDTDTVAPNQYAERMQPAFERALRRVGLFALLNDEGHAAAKGTAFFTKVCGRPLVLTARHVVRTKLENVRPGTWPFTSREVRLMVFRRDAELHKESQPLGFPLGEHDVVWEDSRLDAIAFSAPTELVASGACDFIEADSHPEKDPKVLRHVRSRWREVSDEETSLATFIVGFPNITHQVDEAMKLERLGLLPMPAYITGMEAQPWDAFGEKAPQLTMELDPGAVEPAMPPFLKAAAATWKETLLRSVADGERPPLGGISGAPVFLAHQHGEAVIGLVKEGSPYFGAHIVAASSCWDDILVALQSKLAEPQSTLRTTSEDGGR
jgi:hypothetical protein